jgi:type IV secretory pathway protease TraF
MNASPLLMIALVQGLFVLNAGLPELTTEPPVIINETPSMAKGAYVRVDDAAKLKRGDIIAMPMTGQARDYLVRKLGYPEDTMLLKRVAGISGDLVCRQETAVTIGTKAVVAARMDRHGNPLPAWSGCRVLSPNEVFLLGDHTSSFDSRYFGPVTKDELAGIYRAAVTW